MAENGFLIVGVADSEENTAEVQTSIVGIATHIANAEELIVNDYMDMIKTKSISPITHPLTPAGSPEGQYYFIKGYLWHVIPVPFNEAVNFTL